MRSSRMRGYGSWSIGWREGERLPPSEPSGCGTIAVLFFFGLVALSCFRVAFDGGGFFAFVLGLAVIAGVLKGMR